MEKSSMMLEESDESLWTIESPLGIGNEEKESEEGKEEWKGNGRYLNLVLENVALTLMDAC